MGYTNYWGFKKNPKDIENGADKFKQAVTMLKKGIKILKDTYADEDGKPLILRGGNGEGEPIFSDTLVLFNGDRKTNKDYESCCIELDMPDTFSFDFCKTARMPYDVAVCLTLLCFRKAFGKDFSYRSDGSITAG